jgi:hypothetical protein
MACIADIVFTRHRANRTPTCTSTRRMPHVFVDSGAIHGDVGGMDNKVWALISNPAGERCPIVREMRLAGAQMLVRDLNEVKSHIKSANYGYFYADPHIAHPIKAPVRLDA